jgi:hypothetical protein
MTYNLTLDTMMESINLLENSIPKPLIKDICVTGLVHEIYQVNAEDGEHILIPLAEWPRIEYEIGLYFVEQSIFGIKSIMGITVIEDDDYAVKILASCFKKHKGKVNT